MEGLSDNAIKMMAARKPVNIQVDPEVYQAMNEIAKAAGSTIPDILSKLAVKYRNCNFLERQIVIKFLTGV